MVKKLREEQEVLLVKYSSNHCPQMLLLHSSCGGQGKSFYSMGVCNIQVFTFPDQHFPKRVNIGSTLVLGYLHGDVLKRSNFQKRGFFYTFKRSFRWACKIASHFGESYPKDLGNLTQFI